MEQTHTKNCASHQYQLSGAERQHQGADQSKKDCDCDSYHTFRELYDHRIELFIALCRTNRYSDGGAGPTWRSKLHSDGSKFDGWFILGLGKREGQQITYHLPESKWESCDFAETLEKAPEFDGHTSEDVLKRLSNL